MKALPKILLALTAVAALSVACPAKANLITNPGFETGFTGWTVGGLAFTDGTFSLQPPHSGNSQAVLFGGSSLTQSVATTPGASYTIDFFSANSLVTSPNSFIVTWGGATILSLTNQPPVLGYTEYTFTETASTASTALAFNFGQGAYRFLDDVSVNRTPDAGSTLPLLGSALLAVAALRRKLRC